MTPHFCISPEPAFDLVIIEMSGFFEPADIERFEAARNTAHRKLTSKPNEHVTLVDIRGMLIQSQEAVERFRAILMNPAYTSKRIAIVVSKTLARMQIQRAAAGRDVKFFTDDTAAARAWLLGD